MIATFLIVFKFGALLGMQDLNADSMAQKLEDMLPVIQTVSEKFKNPVSA